MNTKEKTLPFDPRKGEPGIFMGWDNDGTCHLFAAKPIWNGERWTGSLALRSVESFDDSRPKDISSGNLCEVKIMESHNRRW